MSLFFQGVSEFDRRSYWKLDAGAYDYPTISVPWDPSDAVDPKLSQLRDDRGYSYADIITVHPEKLPEYDTKVSVVMLLLVNFVFWWVITKYI